jgi:secondary thiamine-phosphate synthase enzyme
MLHQELKFNTTKQFTLITDEVKSFVDNNKIINGVIEVFTPHTTTGLIITENELLHLVDIRFFLDKVAPFKKEPEGPHGNVKYLHDLISLRNDVPEDEPINGHSHIRRIFFDTSIRIPVLNGECYLGDWSDVFFVELDPGRDRKVLMFCEGVK